MHSHGFLTQAHAPTTIATLLDSGIEFELWERFQYPTAKDRLAARGILPACEVSAVIAGQSRVAADAAESKRSWVIPLQGPDGQALDDSEISVEIVYVFTQAGPRVCTLTVIWFAAGIIQHLPLTRWGAIQHNVLFIALLV